MAVEEGSSAFFQHIGRASSRARVQDDFTEYDHLDITQLAGVEYVLRWWHQQEEAIRRSLAAPDLLGLGNMMPSQTDGGGGLALSSFTHWFAGAQRDQARVLKQQRLMKEEQGHLARTHSFVPSADAGAAGSEKKVRRESAAAAKKCAKAALAATQ